MKNLLFTFGVLLTLAACTKNNQKNEEPFYFQEKELSFLHLRNGYDTSNHWIKKPENILMLHETFKKVGYKKLVSKEEWTDGWCWPIDLNKTPKNFIDSLESTYKVYEKAPIYYQEFWQRRVNEKNDKAVYKVVSEIKLIMTTNQQIAFDAKAVNDTLYNLMDFEYPKRSLSDKEANELLNYLIEIGLHTSAYNLVSREREQFWDTKWNVTRKETLKLLGEAKSYPETVWYKDNTK